MTHYLVEGVVGVFYPHLMQALALIAELDTDQTRDAISPVLHPNLMKPLFIMM